MVHSLKSYTPIVSRVWIEYSIPNTLKTFLTGCNPYRSSRYCCTVRLESLCSLFLFLSAKALKKTQAAYSVPHAHVGQPEQAGNQWWLGTDGCRPAINANLLCARISAGRHGVGGTFPRWFRHLEYTTPEKELDKESVPRGEFRWLYIGKCLHEYEWLQWIIQMFWHVLCCY